jgi:hypothetical protein
MPAVTALPEPVQVDEFVVRIATIELLESDDHFGQFFVRDRFVFRSCLMFESVIRSISASGGVAVCRLTWADETTRTFRLQLGSETARNPEPFLSHVRAHLAEVAAGDVPAEDKAEARRLLLGYQVSL